MNQEMKYMDTFVEECPGLLLVPLMCNLYKISKISVVKL